MRNRIHLFAALPALAILAASNCFAQLKVTSTADSGPGTLRDAIAHATPGTAITFDPSLTGKTITLNSELDIQVSLFIWRPGGAIAGALKVSGNSSGRVFHITNGASVSMTGLTIADGLVQGGPGQSANGGGILVDSGCSLTMSNCWVMGNAVIGGANVGQGSGQGNGGGIYAAGSLVLGSCTVSGNTATGGDGGTVYPGGTAVGAGIDAEGPSASLGNCTIAMNWATGGHGAIGGYALGGGLAVSTNLTLNHCTVSGNGVRAVDLYSYLAGGGVYGNPYMSAKNFTIGDTIVASNSISNVAGTPSSYNHGPDVKGVLTSLGFNLLGVLDASSSGWIASDMTGKAALLGPLQNNGGPTWTMLPTPKSPAIDAGTTGGLWTDQRGYHRPVIFGGRQIPPGGDGSDIGAVEVQAASIVPNVQAGTGTIGQSGSISWTSESGYSWTLLESFNPDPSSTSWVTSSVPVITSDGVSSATLPLDSPTGSKFFRLVLWPPNH
jgi:hypothetical protein